MERRHDVHGRNEMTPGTGPPQEVTLHSGHLHGVSRTLIGITQRSEKRDAIEQFDPERVVDMGTGVVCGVDCSNITGLAFKSFSTRPSNVPSCLLNIAEKQ